MLSNELLSALDRYPSRECLSFEGVALTYEHLMREVDLLAAPLAPWAGRRVGLWIGDGPQLVSALIALDRLGAEAYLIGRETPQTSVLELANEHRFDFCLTDLEADEDRLLSLTRFRRQTVPAAAPARTGGAGGRVVLFTSGTSGRPKGAMHTWQSLAAGIKRDPDHQASRWLLTYGLTRFAGLQVFLQAYLNGGRLTILRRIDAPDIIQALATEQIENVSGTPTFWRKLLTGAGEEDLRRCRLKQITLGGEIVSQGILNALAKAFPQAQITHIYASTEMGVCFSVKDRREGFPVELLNRENGPVTLRIEDGQLSIRSSRAMAHYVGREETGPAWYPTGDLVEIRGDRVYFLGRKSEIINVGGSKVYPSEVEEELRKVPGVADARVYGSKSSFVGQLVSAEVAVSGEAAEPELRERILAHCAAALPAYKRPRLITFVAKLEQTAAQKVARRAGEPS